MGPTARKSCELSQSALDRAEQLEWVVKLSKFCNLRCSYCYEFDSLADPSRISLGQIDRMFNNIRRLDNIRRHEFIWHGGEPTLLPVEFFLEIAEKQNAVFGADGIAFTNRIQTNLYRLTPEWVQLFRSGFFSSIGVSFDVVGDLRQTCGGNDSRERVAGNLDILKRAGVNFGLISVLHNENVNHIDDIFDFCVAIGCSFRLLPIYRDALSTNNDVRACSSAQVSSAIERITRRWLGSSSDIVVQPVSGAVKNIQKFMTNGSAHPYEKSRDNKVFIVDTNGDLFGTAEAYQIEYRYLNVFNDDLKGLSNSLGWRKSVAASATRVSTVCLGCDFFGICDGYHVAEATPRELAAEESGSQCCVVARTIHSLLVSELISEHSNEENLVLI